MSRNFYLIPQLFTLLLTLICTSQLQATHNRAGEITYRVIGDKTIEATITTYTKASSVAADRDTLTICWGDGNCEAVPRSNGGGNGEILPNDTKVNKYIATHTYSGQAHYVISMTDPNRNGGILNVNFPNSDNVPFHIQTTVTFFNPLLEGPNNSPVLEVPPIDIACLGQPFVHDPGAFDPDGDSLAFRLIVPLQDVNTPVPNYVFPRDINPTGMLNDHTLDPVDGIFYWEAPQQTGEYNIAMYVIQYRNGNPIDTLIRDMQILVVNCDNLPPEIETVDELCVIAGDEVNFDVTATAPLVEADQQVELRAFGAPLTFDISPATFNVAEGYQDQPLTGNFNWETACEHIAKQYYSVTFRAADDFPILDGSGGTVFLSTLKTVRIKVVGPPPEDLQSTPGSGEVTISWERPYFCEETEDDYFLGFRVWRREGSNPFVVDICEPGLEGKGYTLLTPIPIQDIQDDRYFYLDDDVERGRNYCYRVEAYFGRRAISGITYNEVPGLPSEEICVQLSRDIPLITNVSVEKTDPVDGHIYVGWSTPDLEDLDTMTYGGPYTYQAFRTIGQPGDNDPALFDPVPDAIFTANSILQVDTNFIDSTGLNTLENQYSYIIGFYANGGDDTLGYTRAASSLFLEIASTDETNNLDWSDFSIPWDNYLYEVYRETSPGSEDWVLIATTEEPNYSDMDGLVNGNEYCYYVTGFGTYGIPNILDTLINNSQENCGIPLDTIPPCPPILEVTNICDEIENGGSVDCEAEQNQRNNLVWENPNDICDDTDDVVSYNIYYSPTEGGELVLIDEVSSSLITDYEHFPELGIAGCYAVTAVDTFFNESAFSNIVCKDNCPIYDLPNTFTPNDDGANDLFIPYPYCFVESINIKIYNRWGELVFETNDPDINWNGRNFNDDELAEGVYHYTCEVFEQRVAGVVLNPEILRGYIHLIRGN